MSFMILTGAGQFAFADFTAPLTASHVTINSSNYNKVVPMHQLDNSNYRMTMLFRAGSIHLDSIVLGTDLADELLAV